MSGDRVLTVGAPDADSAKPASSLLAIFEELKETPVGVVIYDQISQLLAEEEAAQRNIQRMYGMLLRLMLDAYAANPTLAHVNKINAKLSELRRALESPAGAGPPSVMLAAEAESQTLEAKPPSAETGLNDVLNELLRGNPSSAAPAATDAAGGQPKPPDPPPARSAVPDRQDARAPSVEERDEAPGALHSERRVNSAYRLHLDRKRSEIAKLQEAFAQNVNEAVAQNREFGALLQIELNALQQAESGQEIETLRQILIGGIEELIQGHRSLEVKLRRTSEFLTLIRSDSDRLRDELNKVRLLSLTDEYTGLPNRRAFMRRLQD